MTRIALLPAAALTLLALGCASDADMADWHVGEATFNSAGNEPILEADEIDDDEDWLGGVDDITTICIDFDCYSNGTSGSSGSTGAGGAGGDGGDTGTGGTGGGGVGSGGTGGDEGNEPGDGGGTGANEPTVDHTGVEVAGGGSTGREPIRLADALNCFDLSPDRQTLSEQITVYIDTPNPGSTYTNENTGFGHVWMAIEQTFADGQTARVVLGFYPEDRISQGYPESNGEWRDDSGRPYDVSVTMPLPGEQQLRNLATSFDNPYVFPAGANSTGYHLTASNSTHFIEWATTAAGVPMPNPLSASGGGLSGQRPAAMAYFAEHNMGLPYGWTRDTAGGTTPDTTGCQVGQDDAGAPQQLFGQPGG